MMEHHPHLLRTHLKHLLNYFLPKCLVSVILNV